MERQLLGIRNKLIRARTIEEFQRTYQAYQTTKWGVNHMKYKTIKVRIPIGKTEKLPTRNWTSSIKQTSHVFHEAAEHSERGLKTMEREMPRIKKYGYGKKVSLPTARRI